MSVGQVVGAWGQPFAAKLADGHLRPPLSMPDFSLATRAQIAVAEAEEAETTEREGRNLWFGMGAFGAGLLTLGLLSEFFKGSRPRRPMVRGASW